MDGNVALAAGYDPLAVDPSFHPRTQDLTVHDSSRNRDIPMRITFPANESGAPVVLFSHGLGGSRAGSQFLSEHWAARGYVTVFIQHPGSDDSVWKDAAPEERMAALRKAASLENFVLRINDVHAVIDQLATWNKSGLLMGRMDLNKIGMSGHSFGAITTEAVSGETLPLSGRGLRDQRIKAAVIMSPSVPHSGNADRASAQSRFRGCS
jgi:predicted dienelactone hydrolase